MTMSKLMCALLAAAALSFWSDASYALGQECNAGIGNGSEIGDPGNSGEHNQAANAPAEPGRLRRSRSCSGPEISERIL